MDGSVQVFVTWQEVPNGLQATCRLQNRGEPYVTTLPVDATASSIDANILGHWGLHTSMACCVHDGNVPMSLRGLRPQPQQYNLPYHPV